MIINSDTIRLFQVTDSHCYASDNSRLTWTDMPIYPNLSLQATLKHIAKQVENYSALIVTGDLAQEETTEAYQRVNQMLNEFPLSSYVVPGNHDIPELMTANLDGKVAMREEVVFGKWHLLFLDTHADGKPDGSISLEQFDRFEALLSNTPEDDFVAVFMHHHPVPIDSEWMDVMGLREKDYFWNLVEHFPQVKAVFNGHIHQEFSGQYEYADGRTVPVYGTPATCVQMKPRKQNIEFDHTRPAWRDIALNADGSVDTKVYFLDFIIRTEVIKSSI